MNQTEPAPPSQAPENQPAYFDAGGPRASCRRTMIALMRKPEGATAAELGAAVGWQVHSVRGFIAGTLKKRPGAVVIADRSCGATRYRLVSILEA